MKKFLIVALMALVLTGCKKSASATNDKDFTGIYTCQTKGAKKEGDVLQKRVLTVYDNGAHALDNNGVYLSLDWANAREDLINHGSDEIYLQYEKVSESGVFDYNMRIDKYDNITAIVQFTDLADSSKSTFYQMDCIQLQK